MSKRFGLERACDVLGIGFGPSNIALAIAAEEADTPLDIRFIDANESPAWQASMLLAGSDIQHNPLRDLVTPRNPRSRYSFTNYLKEVGRLFEYLNLGIQYPFRAEYAQYVKWVAEHFSERVRYNIRALTADSDSGFGCWRVETNEGLIAAKALVVGTGRNPNIPQVFRSSLGKRVFHLSEYLPRIGALHKSGSLNSVMVLGASQSAVEINIDLLNRFPALEVHAVHRSFSMRQKDASPYSDRAYFPDFVDYFFNASVGSREQMKRELRGTNYNAADSDVLKMLYLKSYEERLSGIQRFHVHMSTVIENAEVSDSGVTLTLREHVLGAVSSLRVDAVILATGFVDLAADGNAEGLPAVLSGIANDLRQSNGSLIVGRDYCVYTPSMPPLYLNGLCENSHGLGDAGSFSLVSLRSADILESLEGRLAGTGTSTVGSSGGSA